MRNLYTKLLLSSAAIAAISAPTQAQVSQDEIIVTATKRAQTLQDVPIAVSVVGADTIEKAQIIDLIDLQVSVPSLRVVQLQNTSQTNFVIRGFGNGANNPGIEGSVGIFIDGVFRSRGAAALLDLPSLERVEVLRGPQSTLFGKNVSVGAVSVTTKKPEFDFGGVLEATIGNLDRRAVKGTVTGPITENIAYRVSGSYTARDGTFENLITGNDLNDRNRWSTRAQLLWEPNDISSFRLTGEWNQIDEVCCGAVQISNSAFTSLIGAPVGSAPGALGIAVSDPSDPFAREVSFNVDPSNDIQGRGLSFHANVDLGFADFTAISAFSDQDVDTVTDADFSAGDFIIDTQDLDLQTFTQELRFSSKGEGPLSWLVGATYFNEDISFNQNLVGGTQFRDFFETSFAALGAPEGAVGLAEGLTQLGAALSTPGAAPFTPFGGVLDPIAPFASGSLFSVGNSGNEGDFTLDNTAFSIFANADYEVTDRFTVSGGVSFIRDNKDATGDITVFDIPTALGQDAITQLGASTETSLLAGAILGSLLPASVGGPVVFDLSPASLGQLLTAAGTLAATDPQAFAALQAQAVGGAQAFTSGAAPTPAALQPIQAAASLIGLLPVTLPPELDFPSGTVDGNLRDSNVNFNIRGAYDITDSVNAYASYTTGWKAGSFNLQTNSGSTLTVDPEDIRLIEIGLKTKLPQGFINIALFDQTVENLQQSTFNGTGFDLVNAGQVSILGAEVDIQYNPIEALTITASGTLLDPEFDEFVRGGNDLSGTRPGGISTLSFTTSATYNHEFSSKLDGFARVEYFHESDTDINDFGGFDTRREINIVNGSIGLETDSGLGLSIWGRNITDNEFFIEDFGTPLQQGSISVYAAEPRTFGGTIRKRF